MLFGFFVMGILAYRTYTASMPLPDKVVTQSGEPLFSGADITRGQEIFQARGLMQYGSINATAPTWVLTSPPTTCAGRPRTSANR